MTSVYSHFTQAGAHRGASGYAPENTASAIIKAADMGARWVEVDVNLCADHQPVIFHDHTIDRCSNQKGLLIQHTLDELKQLDVGEWFAHPFVGERILTLDELLDCVNDHTLALNLEIKPPLGFEQATFDAVKTTLDAHQSKRELPIMAISSFSRDVLHLCKQQLPNIERALLVEALPDNVLEDLHALGASALHCDGKQLLADPELQHPRLQAVQEKGYPVLCYTINQLSMAQSLADLNIHGVFTDNLDVLSDVVWPKR